jgi:preprotein translocase SecE subunit
MNLLNYLKETKAELKEVKFPTTSQTIVFTMTVILVSIIVAALLGAVDLGLKEGLIRVLER